MSRLQLYLNSRGPGFLGCSLLLGLPLLGLILDRAVTGSEIKVGTLANGMHYLVHQHSTQDHRIAVELCLSVGSQNEAAMEGGMAHYLEHMAFNGAGEFGQQDIVTWLQANGLSLGKDENAETSPSETRYRLVIPDKNPKALDLAVRFLAAVASQMRLEDAMIDKERPIILAEMAQRDDVDSRLNTVIHHSLAGDSGSVTPVIGTVGSVSSFHRPQLLAFYRRWYRPERATLIITGDLGPGDWKGLINSVFSPWNTVTTPPINQQTAASNQSSVPTISTLQLGDLLSPIVVFSASNHLKSTSSISQLHTRLLYDLTTTLLRNRLNVARDRSTLHVAELNLGDDYESDSQLRIYLELGGVSRPCADTVKTVWQEWTQLKNQGLTKEEWAQVREEVLRHYESQSQLLRFGSAAQQDDMLHEIVLSGLSELDIAKRPNVVKQEMAQINPEELNVFMKQSLPDQDWHLTVITPETPVPSKTLSQALHDGATETPSQWVDLKPLPQFLAPNVPPSPSPKVTRETDPHVASLQLANHTVVHTRSMPEAGPNVVINLSIGGGESEESKDTRGCTLLAAQALRNLSTSNYTKQQIAEWLQVNGMKWEVSTARNSVDLSLTCPANETRQAMQFLYLVLSDAVVQDSDVLEWRTQMGEMLTQQATSPLFMCAERIKYQLFGADPRFNQVPLNALERITREAGQGWLNRLTHQNFLEIGITSNLSESSLHKLINQYLGALPARDLQPLPFTTPIELGSIRGPFRSELTTQGSTGAAAIVFRSASPQEQSKFDGLEILCSILQERLRLQVREKLGGAYQVQCSQEKALPCTDGGFLVIAFTSPENKLDESCEICRQTIAQLVANGPNKEEVQCFLNKANQQTEVTRHSPAEWARRLAHITLTGKKPWDAISQNQRLASAANIAFLNKLLQRYFTAEREFSAKVHVETASSSS